MSGAIKIVEFLPDPAAWPIWAKIWIGFWLCITLYCGVLAWQQWRIKQKEKSQQSRYLRFPRLGKGGNVGLPEKLAADSDLNGPTADKF